MSRLDGRPMFFRPRTEFLRWLTMATSLADGRGDLAIIECNQTVRRMPGPARFFQRVIELSFSK